MDWIKLYNRAELIRKFWYKNVTEWCRNKDKFIPVRYETPTTRCRTERGYTIRYIIKEDLTSYL